MGKLTDSGYFVAVDILLFLEHFVICLSYKRMSALIASFPGLHPSSALFVLQATKAGVEAWERGYALLCA